MTRELAQAEPAAFTDDPTGGSIERSLDPTELVRTLERTLRARASSIGPDDDRDTLIDDLRLIQRLEDGIRVHLNHVAPLVFGGKHPKHWLWRQHKQWILDRTPPGSRVLDVGCGSSAYLLWMAEQGCEVLGIDLRREAIELASSIMTHPRLRFETCDICETIPPGEWDVAVCSHVIEHLDDPIAILRRLREVVPRVLVAVPPMHTNWHKLMHRELGMRWMDDPDHRREYTADLLREQLETAGWTIRAMHDGIDIKSEAIR